MRCFCNLTDLTLADQTTNSIQSDDANMAIQDDMAMQVTQYGGQLWNQYEVAPPDDRIWCHLVTQLSIDPFGAP